MQTLQRRGGLNDIDHAAAFHYHLPAVLISGIDDLLYTIHIRGKGRYDDPRILMLRKKTVNGSSYRPLGGRKAEPLRIGGVTHQRQHALSAKLRKTLQINDIPEYRRIIHLKISGMHYHAGRGIDRQRRRVHDTVIRPDKLDPELSEIDRLPKLDYLTSCLIRQIMLSQLVLNDSHRQPGGIDRNIHLFQNIGQRPDMVLMPVGNHKSFHLLGMIPQIRDIRDHQIDPQHFILRERQAAVYHNNTVFILEGSNIKSNLFQPSQRNYLQPGNSFSLFNFFQIYFLHSLIAADASA